MTCLLCAAAGSYLFANANRKPYRRCDTCGLIFLEDGHHLDAAAQRTRYQEHNNRPDDPEYRNFLNRLLRHLVPRLPPAAEGLDFGSGPGPALSVMLEEQGYAMTNYDPHFAPNEAALARTYDFITCTETIEHFTRPGDELARMDRLLRPGGWLGVMTEWLESDAQFAGWHYHRDPTHVCFWQPRTLEWVARTFQWKADYPAKNVALFMKAS